MPRVFRRAKRRSAGYDEHHVTHLLRGVYLCTGHAFATKPRDHSGDFTDYDAMRVAWDILRADLLPKFIAENPGHRPFAWWRFDAPESRRRLDGKPQPAASVERSFGIPRGSSDAKYESEVDFLDRHGLLADAERRTARGMVSE